MTELRERAQLLPEPELPDIAVLIAKGRKLAETVTPGRNAFLDHYGVDSEAEYKRRCVAEGRVMLHAHIGFNDAAKTARACAEIWEALDKKGYRIDRFGYCFDENMGYPPHMRAKMGKGASLILEKDEDWLRLTRAAPVAPHFGDYMIGQPAAVENASMAIQAGATTMGNLGSYYAYRMLYMDDDVAMTAAIIEALALVAAQPAEIVVTANTDDGFGPLFTDLSCNFGLVLVEQRIVETLMGARYASVFGNMFADPMTRMAFQRALGRMGNHPGPMVYGSTTKFDRDHTANRAVLANYLTFDIAAQRLAPSGHAVTPIPVTEYERIPDTDEIIDVHLFANRLIERAHTVEPMLNIEAVDAVADDLVAGGERFRDNLLKGFAEAGIDTDNPLELLLAIRRTGAKNLESWFGPGELDEASPRGRRPIVLVENIAELDSLGAEVLGDLPEEQASAIRDRGYTACVATTDVHEYGKILLEQVMRGLDVAVLDGGVSADPDDLVAAALAGEADFIALSTNNGIALSYLTKLRAEMAKAGLDIPIYLGGRLNQVPEGSNTSLPVDVSAKLRDAGAVTCENLPDLLGRMAETAGPSDRAA
jgi:methylmalonyl-CoA mutase cobalamin-binding subunit